MTKHVHASKLYSRLESNLNSVHNKHCSYSLHTQKPVTLEQDLPGRSFGDKNIFLFSSCKEFTMYFTYL